MSLVYCVSAGLVHFPEPSSSLEEQRRKKRFLLHDPFSLIPICILIASTFHAISALPAAATDGPLERCRARCHSSLPLVLLHTAREKNSLHSRWTAPIFGLRGESGVDDDDLKASSIILGYRSTAQERTSHGKYRVVPLLGLRGGWDAEEAKGESSFGPLSSFPEVEEAREESSVDLSDSWEQKVTKEYARLNRGFNSGGVSRLPGMGIIPREGAHGDSGQRLLDRGHELLVKGSSVPESHARGPAGLWQGEKELSGEESVEDGVVLARKKRSLSEALREIECGGNKCE